MSEDPPLYLEHPAMFGNHPFRYMLSMILVPIAVGAVILSVWWLKCRCTTLIVTEDKLTLRRGIFSKHTNDVYHSDVRNIVVKQTFLQRIFRVGAIDVASSGHGGIELSVEGIPEPHKIKNLINKHRH